MYSKDGWPLTVQQQANVAANNMNAPVPTKTYGTEFEKSALSSKNFMSFTCIQIPAHNMARPVAYEHIIFKTPIYNSFHISTVSDKSIILTQNVTLNNISNDFMQAIAGTVCNIFPI